MSTTIATPVDAQRRALPPTPITFEEFLAWCDGETRAEWVDGEVILLSPNSRTHQWTLAFLNEVVTAYVRARRLGEVVFAPFLMRLPTRPSGREPDLLFVTNAHADRWRETYLDGPADLVVEIISPESDERDRGTKFVEYEAARIPEYWLVDALRAEAWFYQLGEGGRYHLGPIDQDGFYHSAVLPASGCAWPGSGSGHSRRSTRLPERSRPEADRGVLGRLFSSAGGTLPLAARGVAAE